MIQTFINSIFIAGWYISAILFAIQAFKVWKTKNGKGVSMFAAGGFFLLNINSSFWMYFHQEYLCILATLGIAFSSLASLVLAQKYGTRTQKYDAVIFDLDGTLLDTQTPVHATAECAVLKHHNVVVKSEDISSRFAGISTKKVFKELAPELDAEELLKAKWRIVKNMLETTSPEPIDKMETLLAHLWLRRVPVIIASASPRWYIEMLLTKSMTLKERNSEIILDIRNLAYYFGNNFVSAEEVAHPKPAPDVFLEAAKRLNVNPKRCLVIGDGKSDVDGGTAAGMDVIFLGDADQKTYDLPNVLTFSKSADLVSYLIKQTGLF